MCKILSQSVGSDFVKETEICNRKPEKCVLCDMTNKCSVGRQTNHT